MTWIKPSFAWMMYRSGWGQKPGQERILRIEVSKEAFSWALQYSCLSAFHPGQHDSHAAWRKSISESPVRVQWDPERDLLLNPLPWRTVQIGIGPVVSDRYADEWVLAIDDYTAIASDVRSAVERGDVNHALRIIPEEEPVVLAFDVMNRIGATHLPNFPE